MPLEVLGATKARFFAFSSDELDAALVGWGWPAFRGEQVRGWVYEKLAANPGEMTNLSKMDRAALAERMDFATGTIASQQVSSDGTVKLLITWPASTSSGQADRANAETVMIPDGDRRTACVSSQVGCPVGCKFCASGINGVKGNLSAAQIVEQVFQLNRILQPRGRFDSLRSLKTGRFDSLRTLKTGERITNIVFMGMGEPLANYNEVTKAIRVLHDPGCFNLGARRITISTVGVPMRMRQLALEQLPVNLAISLHAPNEALRKQLIPWAEHFALDEILDAARDYFEQSGREITLEYILLSGVNDRPEQARELAMVCKTLRANVNLIRYNEVEGLPYRRPKAHDVTVFQEILRHNGVNAHVRKSRGRDIDAACGQLRRKEAERAGVSGGTGALGGLVSQ